MFTGIVEEIGEIEQIKKGIEILGKLTYEWIESNKIESNK